MKQRNTIKSNLSIFSLSIVCVLLGMLHTVPVSANQGISARHVNDVQNKQAKSIEEGVRLGRLTPKEARKLRRQQKEITTVERDMREDGNLNASELEELFDKLQRAQHHINKLLRNNVSMHRSTLPRLSD